jgi:hypothetical protein
MRSKTDLGWGADCAVRAVTTDSTRRPSARSTTWSSSSSDDGSSQWMSSQMMRAGESPVHSRSHVASAAWTPRIRIVPVVDGGGSSSFVMDRIEARMPRR